MHHERNASIQTDPTISVDKKIQVENSDHLADKFFKVSVEKSKKEFKDYDCFYCNAKIGNEINLREHIKNCHGPTIVKPEQPKTKSQRFSSQLTPSSTLFPIGFPNFPYPVQGPPIPECEHCGWYASSGTDLMKHKKLIHGDHRSPFDIYKHI